eukprot:scaffold10545_cov131-Isochrysis_galbana.AAC.5
MLPYPISFAQPINKTLYSSLAARLAASDWRTGASVSVLLVVGSLAPPLPCRILSSINLAS